jgi:hypothetical protein
MRKQRLRNMYASLADLAVVIEEKDHPEDGDTTGIVRPGIILAPQVFLNKESEIADVGLEVARLTSVLQTAKAEVLYTPKALAYFLTTAELGFKQYPCQFGMAYETPRDGLCQIPQGKHRGREKYLCVSHCVRTRSVKQVQMQGGTF